MDGSTKRRTFIQETVVLFLCETESQLCFFYPWPFHTLSGVFIILTVKTMDTCRLSVFFSVQLFSGRLVGESSDSTVTTSRRSLPRLMRSTYFIDVVVRHFAANTPCEFSANTKASVLSGLLNIAL